MEDGSVKQIGILFGLPVYAVEGVPDGTICLHGKVNDLEGKVVYHSTFEDDKTGKQYQYMVEHDVTPTHVTVAEGEGNFNRFWELYGHQGNVTKENYPIRQECRDVENIIKDIIEENKKL